MIDHEENPTALSLPPEPTVAVAVATAAEETPPSPMPSPSTYLNLRSPSFDAIEEMLLGGDGDGGDGPSRPPPSPPRTSPASTQEGSAPSKASSKEEASPAPAGVDDVVRGWEAVRGWPSPPPIGVGGSHSLFAPTNAVHMEVQENAKLPTFTLPVDRSNASWREPAPRGRKRPIGVGRRAAGAGGGTARYASIGAGARTGVGGGDSSFAPCPASPLPRLGADAAERYPVTASSEHGPMDSATSRAVDEILRLSENDAGLTEQFLDGRDREGAALAYGGRPGERSTTRGAAGTGGAPGVLGPPGILPYNRKKPLPIPTLKPTSPPRDADVAAALATAAAIASAAATNAAPSASAPTRLPPPSAAPPPGPAPRPRVVLVPPGHPGPSSFPPPRPSGPLGGSASSPMSVSAPVSQLPASRPPRFQSPGVKPPVANPLAARHNPHAVDSQARARQLAAHSRAQASIARAVAQRSKFGFGGNHRVPAVPAPPPNVKGRLARHPVAPSVGQTVVRTPRTPAGKATPKAAVHGNPRPAGGALPFRQNPAAGGAASASSPARSNPTTKASSSPAKSDPQPGAEVGLTPRAFPTRNPYVPSTALLPKDVSSVIAYERKKQRAKNARVKLNESIEELATAIELAGSQSKERLDYVVASTGTSGAPRNPLARLMNETLQQASTAKKWDRPAFVGLAATVIRSLNAQCEGLTREVAQLRKLARSGEVGTSAAVGSLPAQQAPLRAEGVQVKQGDDNDAPIMPPVKRQKLDQNDINVVLTPNLLKNIAAFLDPASLCACHCASQLWRSQNIFQHPELWLNICIKRFGISAVRKCQDDDDSAENDCDGANLNVKLYRRMSELNVKPFCPFEGSTFLGQATLDGQVSCWASVVDRSNGETYRSVMQQKNQGGETRNFYGPMQLVEMRLIVQNTGYSKGAIVVPDQRFSVDASTRRKGEKMLEVTGDERFKRKVLHSDRRPSFDGDPQSRNKPALGHEMCRLRLFETAVLSVHFHARGCSTTAKFCSRSKKIQLTIKFEHTTETTKPLVIPFHSMNGNGNKQFPH